MRSRLFPKYLVARLLVGLLAVPALAFADGISIGIGGGAITDVSIANPPNGPIIYVDATATGNNDGSSWPDAYTSLAQALADSSGGEQFWIAAGSYYPDECDSCSNDSPDSTFALQDGQQLYGGFAGSETAFDQRDPVRNITSLSGDLTQNDLRTNGVTALGANVASPNARIVVTGPPTSMVLDGVYISGATTNGVAADTIDTTLRNCVVAGTRSGGSGARGALFVSSSGTVVIQGCTFYGNESSSSLAYFEGAGLYVGGAATVLVESSSFVMNRITNFEGTVLAGAGVSLVAENITLKGVRVENNSLVGGGSTTCSAAAMKVMAGTLSVSDFSASGNRLECYKSQLGGAVVLQGNTITVQRASVAGNNVIRAADNADGTAVGLLVDASGSAVIDNITVAANETRRSGPGALLPGAGFAAHGDVTVTHGTFIGNGAAPAEVGGSQIVVDGDLTLANSLVAQSAANTTIRIISGSVIDGGYNLIGVGGASGMADFDASFDAINGTGTSFVSGQALAAILSPLSQDGSVIAYAVLRTTGDAFKKVPAVSCEAEDALGNPRGDGGFCDIGAVEYTPPAVASAAANGSSGGGALMAGLFVLMLSGLRVRVAKHARNR